MAPTFPSPVERIVASALLLLSVSDRSPTLTSPLFDTDGELLLKSKNVSDEDESLSLVSSGDSKRCASSVTGEDGSSNEIRGRKLSIIAVVPRCHEMKLHVMRKNRSKISRNFESGKPPPPPLKEKPETSSDSISTEAGSCISGTGSAISSARSCYTSPEESTESSTRKKPRKSKSGSTPIDRRAEAILKLLSSGGGSSEIKIRQALGDSPDTSKALRMLLKTDEVKRSGTGGRHDPYIYMVASN